MKTYIQPLIQEQQLDTHPVMLDSSEIDITDEPVNPRGSANSRRDSWGDGSWRCSPWHCCRRANVLNIWRSDQS